MLGLVTMLTLAVIGVGCASTTLIPTNAPTSAPSLRPLPESVGGIPKPGDPAAVLAARSPPGELTVGVARNFTFGHSGLGSPIDIDGSLWDPVAGHDGNGGPLTDDQIGELINATPIVVVLIDPQTAELRTPRGAVITLTRHEGPRAYFLCD